MEPHDLVLSKLGAGREKDLNFKGDVATFGIVRRDELLARLETVSSTEEHRRQITMRVHALFK